MRPDCPICQTPESADLLRGIPDRYDPSRTYSIARCRSCRIAFTHPVRESYPEEYGPHQVTRQEIIPKSRGTRAAIVRAFYQGQGSVLERLALFVPYLIFRARDWMKVRERDLYKLPFRVRGRLLDVGCGNAVWLEHWLGQHQEAIGVEPHRPTALAVRRQRGIDVRPGELEEQDFPANSFDAVTLCHVLEHVPRPQQTLREAARILRPGGELILWMPNFDSLLRRIFGRAWFPYDVPRHLWHFRVTDVTRMVRRAGLTPVEVAHDAHEWTFRQSMKRAGRRFRALFSRRRFRVAALLTCLFFRRADNIRIRSVKP